MKSHIHNRCLSIAAAFACVFVLGARPIEAAGARLKAGQIVGNFTLSDRAGKPVSLEDFAGKIIFLEWFTYWCPYCRAAAQQIEPGIVDYYHQRGGNPDGLEVVHVLLNLQAGAEPPTTAFINQYKLGQSTVLNDFFYGVPAGTMNTALINQFGTRQPTFAIVNGVANSASHKQWELLYSRDGYGDLAHPINDFRKVIDSVKRAIPVEPPSAIALTAFTRAAEGSMEFQVTGNRRSEIRIQASSDLVDFTDLGPAPLNPADPFKGYSAAADHRFYRAVRVP